MRAVVQRVSWAKVRVGTSVVGDINHGLVVFVGVGQADGPADVQYLAGKIRELRIFGDSAGRMNLSLQDTGGDVLVVSQFTLYGDCRKGRRPSFDAAGRPTEARLLYEDLVRELRSGGLRVATGEFQAHMIVELVNDGPVTLLLDSQKQF